MTKTDSRLRFRLFIDGELVDENWIDSKSCDMPTESIMLGLKHAAVYTKAEAEGKLWMSEIYDPERPEDSAYVRIGTDKSMMVQPKPFEGV
jgi:hypothetical protein